jgi:hypothetical protein
MATEPDLYSERTEEFGETRVQVAVIGLYKPRTLCPRRLPPRTTRCCCNLYPPAALHQLPLSACEQQQLSSKVVQATLNIMQALSFLELLYGLTRVAWKDLGVKAALDEKRKKVIVTGIVLPTLAKIGIDMEPKIIFQPLRGQMKPRKLLTNRADQRR